MFLSFLSTLFLSLGILGYSYFLKIIILKKKEKILNIDFIYGLFLLTFLSILINFFLPIKYFFIPVILVGVFLFIDLIYKKKHDVSLISFSVISFLIIFISHGQGITYDSQLYHLQTIQLASNNNIIFGIANLQPHYGMNSTWHIFLSLFNFKFYGINLIYLANLSILSFYVNQIFSKKNSKGINISFIFLALSLVYIFTYSFFHPYNNGTILNLLGSPEADLTAMIFYILSIYMFTICIEKKNIEDFYLLTLFVFLTITTKVSYLGVFFFFIYALTIFKNEKFYFNSLNFLILLTGALWILKSIILSGCLIFPISFTCFDVTWALDQADVKSYSQIVQSFARDTPERLNFTNFNYTLYSSEWFAPWFKHYFLKTEFLYISFIFIFLSLILFIIFFNNKKHPQILKNIFFVYIVIFILNLILWMRAPEIRFGYGTIISFVCILLSYNLKMINYNNYNNKFLLIIFIMIFMPIVIKNLDNYKKFNDISFVRNFDHSEIKKIYASNNFEVFKPSKSVFCNDFQKFCTYQGFNVNIEKLNGYYFLSK